MLAAQLVATPDHWSDRRRSSKASAVCPGRGTCVAGARGRVGDGRDLLGDPSRVVDSFWGRTGAPGSRSVFSIVLRCRGCSARRSEPGCWSGPGRPRGSRTPCRGPRSTFGAAARARLSSSRRVRSSSRSRRSRRVRDRSSFEAIRWPSARGGWTSIVNLVVRSTSLPIAQHHRPMIRPPSQRPGTSRSRGSVARSVRSGGPGRTRLRADVGERSGLPP